MRLQGQGTYEIGNPLVGVVPTCVKQASQSVLNSRAKRESGARVMSSKVGVLGYRQAPESYFRLDEWREARPAVCGVHQSALSDRVSVVRQASTRE